jgi:CRP-like cAMP-binding protein
LFIPGWEELMSVALTPSFAAIRNQILTGLPREKYHRLFSNLRLVSLTAHQVLYYVEDNIRCAYFINNGMASLLSMTAEGDSIEVGNIGNEGIVGIPVVLRQAKTPHQIVVQVPGDALVVNADILIQEFEKEGELRHRLLSYAHALATYMSQLGVCNHFHTLDKRLCRWLLMSSYQVQSQSFQLTHESLSQVLGTGRTGITMVANKLQRDGLIRHHRGQITILNRVGMEAISCDCYQIVKEVFERSLGLNSSGP